VSQVGGIHGAKDKSYRILVGKTLNIEITEKPRSRWKNNIKMKLKGITGHGMNWINTFSPAPFSKF
jgi:hypothetical protein